MASQGTTVRIPAEKERRWRNSDRKKYAEQFNASWTNDPSALANRNKYRQMLDPATAAPFIQTLIGGGINLGGQHHDGTTAQNSPATSAVRSRSAAVRSDATSSRPTSSNGGFRRRFGRGAVVVDGAAAQSRTLDHVKLNKILQHRGKVTPMERRALVEEMVRKRREAWRHRVELRRDEADGRDVCPVTPMATADQAAATPQDAAVVSELKNLNNKRKWNPYKKQIEEYEREKKREEEEKKAARARREEQERLWREEFMSGYGDVGKAVKTQNGHAAAPEKAEGKRASGHVDPFLGVGRPRSSRSSAASSDCGARQAQTPAAAVARQPVEPAAPRRPSPPPGQPTDRPKSSDSKSGAKKDPHPDKVIRDIYAAKRRIDAESQARAYEAEVKRREALLAQRQEEFRQRKAAEREKAGAAPRAPTHDLPLRRPANDAGSGVSRRPAAGVQMVHGIRVASHPSRSTVSMSSFPGKYVEVKAAY